jgi:transglutaminase-like putative cysteine protease
MLDRRDVLRGALALPGAAIMAPRHARAADAGYVFAAGAWRTVEIATRLEIPAPAGRSEAWIPLPSITAQDWIRPIAYEWGVSSGSAMAQTVGRYGAKLLHVVWDENDARPIALVTNRIAIRDRFIDMAKPRLPAALSNEERELFLSPTTLIPTDGIVKETAQRIVSGAGSDVEKARRLYDWVVVNTFRDPKTRGCGEGDIANMLKSGNLGGKCADLNALFVGLARASGIPARDLYGIRVAPSRYGYKSLGANSTVITKAQHCRAEVYLTEWGWVPADPADVRKIVLEEPPGNLPLDDPKVAAARRTLFGAWETNWIAYNWGHDIALPGSDGKPLAFLMYPQAETAGRMRDCLDADTFRYVITSKEIRA